MIQEAPILVKVVHVRTQLNQDVDLARLREKVEARAGQVDDAGKRLSRLAIETSNGESNAHVLEGFALVDSLTLEVLLNLPHVPA